ncbi:fimbrial protein [Paraburkholderia silvatlantica]|uniref:Major type 1 subunit fimbrin (Pilin) n=1 Tax=Paraburkholderia silvatlantica TaxID=321895 RepID=A0ABR6FMH2_9BURK|nr:fimbrial protein [Paraburkholderia silvatlantica]MBB2928608.1 major type 1 subunit fimbrin (pilin) [Paraburkholderia silvatlantica]PVY16203.1 major type 1 subunit fimbrin (pilin) [Paraburkholderia silvatlantica]TDQ99579.1 major type 1 subunit fimbrin (pilin) [Paraburkholderia silvatlantica]
MKQIMRPLFVAALLGSVAMGAHAADGTITITGSVTSQTCTINGGAPDFTVALPTVAAATLQTAGATAGRTPFTISLTGCSMSTGTVHTFFEQGSTINASTGNLKLNAGGASNVEIQLLNGGDASVIALNQPDAQQNSAPASISDGSAQLSYYAQYVATGAAGAGSANSSVMYTMSYQ